MRWLSLKRVTRDERHQKAALERAYRSVFFTPEGQMVLADLAAHCGMYSAPPVDVDPRASGYVDGQKALFARVLACIRVAPEEHAALQEAARLEQLPNDFDEV
jgi:hypothetical protein